MSRRAGVSRDYETDRKTARGSRGETDGARGYRKLRKIRKSGLSAGAVYGCAVQKDLAPDFSVTDMSFKQTERNSGEIGIAGINKATGMQAYLSHVGQTKEDAIAFGDSANDMEMIDFAACGVAMGNAIEALKARADMVTGCCRFRRHLQSFFKASVNLI